MSQLIDTLNHIATCLNGDAALVRRGRFIDLDFLLGVAEETHYLTISVGRLSSIVPGPVLMKPWEFAIRIDGEAWEQFRQPVPKPNYHDIFAMCKQGTASIEGNIQPLMANLRYFKELLAHGR